MYDARFGHLEGGRARNTPAHARARTRTHARIRSDGDSSTCLHRGQTHSSTLCANSSRVRSASNSRVASLLTRSWTEAADCD